MISLRTSPDSIPRSEAHIQRGVIKDFVDIRIVKVNWFVNLNAVPKEGISLIEGRCKKCDCSDNVLLR